MLKKQVEPAVHGSLGLKAVCQILQGAATCDILELGAVTGDNVQFWSRYHPSLYIADLRSILPLPVMPEEPDVSERPKQDWGQLLPLPENRKFDLVLAWDLLNYLEISDVASLVQYLSRFCRPGTLLFALIFDHKEMPEQITLYRIVDEERLNYECGSSAMRACPRHQPRAIAGTMPQFRVVNSFRLRNSVVEYLLAYEGA
jgi:hypothetical protein